jgi:energy-coupling factor transport system substrate-specific component
MQPTGRLIGADRRVLPLGVRSSVVLLLVSVAGLCMFLWPLLIQASAGVAHHGDAVFVFVLMLPALVVLVLTEVSDGMIDSKALAMLGVLSALGAALRPLGGGVAGIETVFILLVLAGRVYGAGFGFVLGSTTMFASALLTAGVGPWLPFQMLAASWVGFGAALLPRCRGRAEVAMLAAYGGVAAFVYGFLMNMWFWPFSIATDTQISFVAGDAVVANLRRFVLFTFATSTVGWDVGRAITNMVAICLVGSPVLLTLRRAARRAAFAEPVTFVAATASERR